MTHTENEKRNLQGFNGDRYLKQEIERLIVKNRIDLIFETGTFKGETTIQFAAMAKAVVTVEINPDYFSQAEMLFQEISNIVNYLGNSTDVMNQLLPNFKKHKILFYLDAHWGEVCPLKDELRCLAAHATNPVIVIHDFFVPGRDFGYDAYDGQAFTYEWLKPELDAIYGARNYNYFYNKQAEGAYRGVLFCEPKNKFTRFFSWRNLL